MKTRLDCFTKTAYEKKIKIIIKKRTIKIIRSNQSNLKIKKMNKTKGIVIFLTSFVKPKSGSINHKSKKISPYQREQVANAQRGGGTLDRGNGNL